MAVIVQTIKSPAKIRVALIIEGGNIRPVWFETVDNPARDRIHIKQISYVWTHMEGVAKIINFAGWDGTNSYCLSLNTKDFTWNRGRYGKRYQPGVLLELIQMVDYGGV